jgi:Tol biopolymer transport system component
MGRSLRAVSGLGVVALLAVSSAAQATFPGENGRILFVSGKGAAANDDSGSDLYLLSGPGGADTPIDTRPGQHRHPSWSPDLKRVAYALFEGASNEKVWVQNISGTGTPERLGSSSSAVRDDRPSWSPDGKKIAYESEVTDGSGQMDILVKDITSSVTSGTSLNLSDSATLIEGRPVWSPDGKWIYFSRRPMPPNLDDDIMRIRSDGSGTAQFIINSAIAEYQAAISPDGTKLCYTRGPFGGTDADVYVALISGSSNGFDLSDTDLGAYNCTWSPDGRYVAYVRGVFTQGALMYERSNDTGSAQLLTTDTANHFDGNPDWAPKHAAFCQGKPLTKAGTGGDDTINGTSGRDVINAFGGNDLVRGGDGNDTLCGGSGKDDLRGGDGRDALFGDSGADRLNGGSGSDNCVGGPGSDTKISC